MGERRAGIVALISVACALATLAGSASAVGIRSEVTIKESGDGFRGKVRSEHSACVAGRDVKVFQVTPGKNDRVGIDIADAEGDWETGNGGDESGKFYAKVNKFEACKPARSKTIKV